MFCAPSCVLETLVKTLSWCPWPDSSLAFNTLFMSAAVGHSWSLAGSSFASLAQGICPDLFLFTQCLPN